MQSPDTKISQKTIFITGATAGFGEACARLFASKGWNLVLTGRRLERLKYLQAELAAPCHLICRDVRDRDGMRHDIDTLPDEFSHIDVLLNNAGLALGMEPAHKADLDDWETMVDTNINGLMYCTRFLLPGMVRRNHGHIINIGSVAGNWPYPGGNAYGATKAFVTQFSHNLRCDLNGTAIRVSVIEPGLAETEFSVVRFKGDTGRAGAFYQGMEPLRAEDIADTVFWMVSQPPHVNINRIEIMPVSQSCGPFLIHRHPADAPLADRD